MKNLNVILADQANGDGVVIVILIVVALIFIVVVVRPKLSKARAINSFIKDERKQQLKKEEKVG